MISPLGTQTSSMGEGTFAINSNLSSFPRAGTFVINVGNVLEAWTGGAYRATLHRVKNSPTQHRVSAPFFFQPNEESEIAPLEGTQGAASSDATFSLSTKMPFKFGDYVFQKFQISYGSE